MISIIATLVFSFSVNAFEGQPKTVVVMPDLASKVEMQLPDLKANNLKPQDVKCGSEVCSRLFEVRDGFGFSFGSVDYKLSYARVNVLRDGSFQQPFQASVLMFIEQETKNRLTFSLNENTKTLCFGTASAGQGSCSNYSVLENYR